MSSIKPVATQSPSDHFQMLGQANQSFQMENGKTAQAFQSMLTKIEGVYTQLIDENKTLRETAVEAESREPLKAMMDESSINGLVSLYVLQEETWALKFEGVLEQLDDLKTESKEKDGKFEKRIEALEKENTSLKEQLAMEKAELAAFKIVHNEQIETLMKSIAEEIKARGDKDSELETTLTSLGRTLYHHDHTWNNSLRWNPRPHFTSKPHYYNSDQVSIP